MKLQYPAVFSYIDEDKSYLVEFPDLSGCVTEGATMEEAKEMAKEALTGYLESVMDRGIPFSAPSSIPNAVLIEPAPGVSFAFWLRTKRKDSGMTLTDVADQLGIKYQVYQKLENPQTANPTLKTLKRLEAVFHDSLLTV